MFTNGIPFSIKFFFMGVHCSSILGPVDKIVIDTILYYFLLFYVACSDTVKHTVLR